MPRRFIAAHDARRRGGGVPRAIVYVEIDEYIDGLANRGDAALRAVERQGEEEGWPIVGSAEGSLLHILARAIRARRILELGTAIGYSGTWLARALPDDGELVTVEHNPETAAIARKNMEKTGVAKKVKILVGDAQGILKDLKGPFDYIFNDIDKGAAWPAPASSSRDHLIQRMGMEAVAWVRGHAATISSSRRTAKSISSTTMGTCVFPGPAKNFRFPRNRTA